LPVQKRYASFAFAGAKLEFRFDAGIPAGDSHKRDISRGIGVYLRLFYLPRGKSTKRGFSGLKRGEL